MTVQTGPGWMPDVEQQISPNRSSGRSGVTIEAVVIHIMEGGFQVSIDWMEQAGTSAHFAVAKDGRIKQLVNLYDVAYANGLSWDSQQGVWIDPQGDVVHPTWPLLDPPTNPNWQTISIEHEGMTGEPWTHEMYLADQRILVYVQSQIPIFSHVGTTLIGHRDISPKNRANCPGSGFNFDYLAQIVAEPDYVALWGPYWPYFETSGIANFWRRDPARYGMAMTDETSMSNGQVLRAFEHGAIVWTGNTCIGWT